MKFTLNNFYSNNYKDFVHLEALKNLLRKVPELNLAGLENIENILSMEFSVDDWGENPMYIKYIDTDGKEHIVKIRPAVTEQIYEILKAYAKISYVDEQDKKLKDELHTEITQGDENALNLSKTYTDTVVNHTKDEINHTIETTKQQVASNKEAIANNSNRIDAANQLITANDNKTTQALADVNAKIDELSIGGRNYLLGTADFTWPTGIGDWNGPEKTIEQYNTYLKMLHVSNSALGGIYTKWAGAFPNGELQIGENYTFSFDAKGTGTFLSVGNESDNQATKTSVAGTFLSVGNESDNQATKNSVVGTALTPRWKRYSVSGTITELNRAFVIYFKSNYDVYIKCVKIEKGNKATDWTPAPEDTSNELSSINGKIKTTNQQVASNKEAIAINSNRIDGANQLITANDNKTTQALADVNTRIDNIPRASEVTRKGGIFKGRLNIMPDEPNDFYSNVFLEQRDGSDNEFVGRLVKGDVAKKTDLDALNGDVISYVDKQDKKLKDELHTEITQGDENALNLSKAYTDTVVNHTKDEINHTIETTKQDLKGYCDNKCEITLASSKEYTDTKAHELSQRIETGDTETLENSKNYTDTQLAGYETKADAKAEHDKLSAEAENANKVYGYDITDGTWNKCNGNFTVSYDNSSITKLGYRQNNEDVEKGIDFTKLATKQDLNSYCDNKCEITLASSKEYTDTKAHELSQRIDDWTTSLNGKIETTNQQVASNKEAIAINSNRIDSANQLITANDNKTTQALADVNTRIDNIPRASEVTRKGGIFKGRLNIMPDEPNDFYSNVFLEQRDGSDNELVGRLVKGDVAKKTDLDALNGEIETTNQQVASNKEAINAIKQNVFNVAYGKKINGTLQNGWHMKEDKDREFAILWDWNNSDDHSQGAHWIINMNFIYKSNATASDIANFSLIGTVDIPSEVLQQFPHIGDTWVYSGYALQSWRIVGVPFFKFERHENQYQVKIVNTPRTGVLEGDIGEVQINAGGTSANYWL